MREDLLGTWGFIVGYFIIGLTFHLSRENNLIGTLIFLIIGLIISILFVRFESKK